MNTELHKMKLSEEGAKDGKIDADGSDAEPVGLEVDELALGLVWIAAVAMPVLERIAAALRVVLVWPEDVFLEDYEIHY